MAGMESSEYWKVLKLVFLFLLFIQIYYGKMQNYTQIMVNQGTLNLN